MLGDSGASGVVSGERGRLELKYMVRREVCGHGR